jgi:hypothetical protein
MEKVTQLALVDTGQADFLHSPTNTTTPIPITPYCLNTPYAYTRFHFNPLVGFELVCGFVTNYRIL